MGLVGRIAERLEGLFLRLAEFRLGLGGSDLQEEKVAEVAGEVMGDAQGIAVACLELVDFGEGALRIAREDGGG